MSSDRWFADAGRKKEQGDFCVRRNDWRGAYAAYGTAAEFAIKAIYLRNTQQRTMPEELRSARSHDIARMAQLAGLGGEIKRFTGGRRANWLTVRDWDQAKRYPDEPFPAKEGRDFKVAFLNPTCGIWPWLVNHYQSN